MSVTFPMPLQRSFVLIVTLAMALSAMVPLLAPAPIRAASTDVVISQVYGGGGNSGATYTHDFIELFNRGETAVSVSGWSVQYASAAGTSWQVTNLSGTIEPGAYYLIQQAAGAGGTTPLPPPDATGSIAMSATAGKVALSSTITALTGSCPLGGDVVDLVGYGSTASCFEGSGPTAAPSNTNAALRAGSGCQETDDNAADFTVAGPTPRNSASPASPCDSTLPTNPAGSGSATPGSVAPGETTLLEVSVTPGTNPESTALTVIADLSAIGGAAEQALSSTDGVTFTFEAIVASDTTAGLKTLPVAIADGEGRSGAAEISLTVQSLQGGNVVISQLYGGGGNSGATLTHDFIELFNRTDATVSLAGWSVQYASAAGSSWQVTPLSGSIAPGGYYLVQQAQGAGGTESLPPPDATGTIAMAAGSGKVALLSGTGALSGTCPAPDSHVDLVGFGSANCFEGSGGTPTLSNTTAAFRAAGGCRDTNDNADDFGTGAPAPRNSASPANPCGEPPPDEAPQVVSSSPVDGAVAVATDASISITFSEPVEVADGWFEIDCAESGVHDGTVSGGPETYQIDPQEPFVSGDECSVTVVASLVADQDDEDPPDTMAEDHVFAFRVGSACGSPTHFIHEVQGSAMTTPILNAVVTVEGVVVGDFQGDAPAFGGFFIQSGDEDADDDPLTSEGLFVFDGSFGVAVSAGDVVSATGRVIEFNGLTELTDVLNVEVCDSGASVTPVQIELPVENVGDWERWEGMLATFTQTMTVTENFSLGRFGELVLSSHGRQYQGTHVTQPGAAAAAVADLNTRTRIILDDAITFQNVDPTRYPTGGLSAENTLRIGATTEDLTAVVHQAFGSYRLQPVGEIEFDGAADRPQTPPDVGGRIQVAAFNVLNYFNGDGTGGGFPTARGAETPFEFERQHDKIVSAIAALDAEVVGLMEIENDGGDAVPAIQTLVEGLNAVAGQGTYAYVDTGVIGTDAIAVALIYQPSAVEPIGEFALLDSSVDPAFDDQRNRPVLAQAFTETATGASFTVAVNHLKSKGSGCGPGDDQPDALGGNCNGTRTAAAAALASWLGTDPSGSGDPDALIIGDLNSYAQEDPIAELRAAGYSDLLDELVGPDAFTFVFMGASGYLDYALSSETMTAQVTGGDAWHINTDEPPVLDYNTNFKTPNHVATLYAPDAYRSSDHDPVLVGLDLFADPVITSLEVTELAKVGNTVELTATYTDANAAETHTATVDWGDGAVEPAPAADGLVEATHLYTSAGLYTVTLTVTDENGLSDVASFAYVVVYDPAAGFVTGGGRIDTDDGPGSFEISIGYRGQDASLQGDVRFSLPGLEVASTGLDWLVVDGSRAWLRGDATVNGVAGHDLLVAVTDAPDRLRLQISDAETGEIVFDNQPDDPDDAVATQSIRNGQIVVHGPT